MVSEASILVIDDERPNIQFLEDLLDHAGYSNVSSLLDSRNAVQLVNRLHPDIILLDLSMPYRSGLQVMEDIEAVFPGHGIPILVLTADVTSRAKHEALTKGASDFLTKPFDTTEVLLRIKNLIEIRMHRTLLEQRVKERTASLEEANAELAILRKAAQVAAHTKSAFIANMSHELRTPMNGILALTSLMLLQTNQPGLKSQLTVAEASCRKLKQVLDDILEIAELEANRTGLDLRPTLVNAVIEDVRDLYMAKSVDKGVALKISTGPTPMPIVQSDPIRLRQVLGHLVSNGLNFTDEGQVEISLSWITVEQRIRFEITVEDTGIGISEQDLERIFETFSQVDDSSTRVYGGLGLGLSVTRKYVDLLGGSIEVLSSLGNGSTFKITFTAELSHKIPNQTTPVQTITSAPHRAGLRILLVEDNPVNIMVAQSILEFCGCKVEVAENGRIAIEKFVASAFDAVLMDIHMPVCDGVTATQEIRQWERRQELLRVPIVAVTACTHPGEIEQLISIGFDEMIAKPINIEQLREFLGRLAS